MEVYVYTRLPQTGVLVRHHGTLFKGKARAHFTNLHSKGHWMTSLSNVEGEVRGHSVWFTHPNRKGAIEALDAKETERAESLIEKAKRTMARVGNEQARTNAEHEK